MRRFLFKVMAIFILDKDARRAFRIKHGVKEDVHRKKICELGDFSYVSPGCYAVNRQSCIGKYCSIGTNVQIGVSQHPTNWLSTSPVFYFKHLLDFPSDGVEGYAENNLIKPVIIGNDVWIGFNAIIMDGVKIGDGAIIGAQAVVTKDVPPYAIVGGVPARVIRYRFDQETIKALLELKWWDKDPKFLANLPFTDIQSTIRILKEHSND